MDAYISTIMGWGPNWAPRSWALCEGQLLAISQYTAVFSLIGTIYGGDGRTSFGLPDLRGRVPMSFGQSPGTSYHQIGARTGAESHTMSITELPVHHHSALVTGGGGGGIVNAPIAASGTVNTLSTAGTTVDSTNNHLAKGNLGQNMYGTGTADTTLAAGSVSVSGTAQVDLSSVGLPTVTIGNTGGSIPFKLIQPIQVISFIFCLFGIFPPRN